MIRSIVTGGATALLLTLATATAGAHYKQSGEVNEKYGDWYFRGMTFEKEARPLKAKDPINVIFYGGADDLTDYSRARIENHMSQDWDTDWVGGSPWREDSLVVGFCKVDQIARWRNLPGETGDLTDWHGTTAMIRPVCGKQHHLRFWDDKEHADATSHGRRHQWAIAGAHYDRPAAKFCCVKHVVDRDWDHVRMEVVYAMHKHCSYGKWKYHPGADGADIQGFGNFGFIARFSMRHVSAGCAGA
jgi:hypothetical protein